MSLENNIRALERTPVLADIGREALRLLAFSVEKIDISDGQNLFTRGTPADCAYSVVGGRIRLDAGRGGECVVGPGTLIGEMALIVESERPCDAYGEGPARLLVIPRVLFRKMLDEYPQIEELLKPVFEELSLEVLQELNGRVQVGGEGAASVATDYLTQGGFLE